MNPKYPEIEAQFSLSGPDGNAFAIIGRVASLLRKAGYSDEVSAFQKEAMAGDYDNLLVVTMGYVEVS